MRSNSGGIGAILTDLLRGMNLEGKLKEQRCIVVWDEVVGERVASAAQPEYVRDGRLFVVTKSSVWANELGFYKADMIAKLNAAVGGNVIKEIIFKAGQVVRREPEKPVEETEEPGLEGIQLTDRELEQMEGALSGAGEEGAEMMRGLMRTAMRLEKWKESKGWTPCKECGVLQNSESGICPICRMDTKPDYSREA
jgi:predicted nucleic acid-binding Zn ribbon protein